jgi:transcriptional regulator with XRE-family HTH domain
MDFPERLRRLLRLRGKSQAKLAEALGVTQAAVSKWVCGQSEPNIAELLAICRYLDVPVGFLADPGAGEVCEEVLIMVCIIDRTMRELGLGESYRRLILGRKRP